MQYSSTVTAKRNSTMKSHVLQDVRHRTRTNSSLAFTAANILCYASIALCIALMLGCALPRAGVILLASPPKGGIAPSLEPIPPAWDHHLLRVGKGKPELGGEETHSHAFPHQHTAISGPAIETDAPLGLQNKGSKSTHTHLLQSETQSVSMT